MKQRCPTISDPDITEDDLWSSFAKWKESTTTSPSGRHLGHMKSLLHRVDNQTENWPPNTTLPQDIFRLLYNITSICINKCHVLPRWETVHNLLIQKEEGNQKIHCLRTIHIQECNWQAILRISVAKKTLPHAASLQKIHHAQWGGVPGKTAIDPAIQAIQAIDYSHMTLTNMAIQYNDAKSCYDRLIEPQTNIALHALGCPPKILLLHSEVHQHMKFYIKTSNGVAPEYSCHNITGPFWGAGQGACDASARCTATSSTMFHAYDKISIPFIMTNPQHTSTSLQRIAAYVDDATIKAGLPQDASLADIQDIIHHNASAWETLLWNTGGKLEIDKCKIVLLHWRPTSNGRFRLSTKDEVPIHIEIIDSDSQTPTCIPQLNPDESYKYLGVRICADGDHTPQKQFLLQRSQRYAKAMHLCPIDKSGINTAYHACYLPSITYSLPATSFVEEDLHAIQNEATATFLSRLGFNRHCPTEIVYAPRWFGGIGLRHLYCEQGIMKVKRLLAHLRSKSSLGKVLNIIIDWYQQLSGLTEPIFLNTSYIPGTRNQWLTSLRIFLHETNCTIRLENEWSHPIIREHD